MSKCIWAVVLILLGIVAFMLFDWFDAREHVHDALSGLQYAVDVLSDWGDRLQEALGMAQDTGDAAREAVEKARATVEKVSD
ncbi:hypothetical protein SAMN05443662_0064 [Sulfurivirga caldicuralii]|uniref:Uncharacterized protein n=1 Tax=Sulfurivirga caldicuralii TaxID=364032 RepID=A0A1N6DDH8_9GAMM|nr:hypothetical protein [Sulfurivirga caldicuralii]SIN68889.1 hypothetical protein SAMN05443662_0064 [Sulfurivirga caldicuralii]